MKNPDIYFLSPKFSLSQTIKIIDQGAAQIALVVDKDQQLIGTVTDGDIRRGLMKGETLKSSVERVMQREFRFVREGVEDQEVLEFMRREVLHQIPMLDSKGRVIELFLLEDLLKPKSLPNWVVIMAGGEGKRLRPLTENCPKPMLSVLGKPILETIIERCKQSGFHRFFFAVNYLKQNIIEYFGDGTNWGIQIEYIEENQPLGTAGALSLIPQQLNEPFLVINGDVLTQVPMLSLLRFHQEHQACATLSVREHQTVIPYGIVQIKGIELISLEEKPTLTHFVNAGIYVFSPKSLSYLFPDTPCDIPQFLHRIKDANLPVHAFPIYEYWLDVGHPETLNQARRQTK